MRDGLQAFQDNIPLIIQKVIFENEALIIDMNATEQLYEQGINSVGVSIDNYAPYSEYTIEIKKAKGQPTDRVTLHDEGDFSGSFFLDVAYDRFEIKAADGKTQELIRKYGRQILGLTDENIRELVKSYIYPELCTERDRYIYGNSK